MGNFKMKRIYESADCSDGVRVLIDRIWPRGVSKQNAQLTAWMKEIAPSTDLRTWFGHVPERFEEFERRYVAELSDPTHAADLKQLRKWAEGGPVTLLYAAVDVLHNQAVVIKRYLEKAGDVM